MTSETDFVNKFWGQQDAGFGVVQTRLKHSIATLQELLHFYKERVAIEKEHDRKLLKLLATTTLGSHETGTLKVALEKLQKESTSMVEHNGTFVRSVSLQNYEKLNNFYQIYQRNVNKLETHMQKVLTRKQECAAQLQAAQEKYRTECGLIKALTLLCQTTWGKEHDKHQSKLHKLMQSNSQTRRAYSTSVQKCAEIHEVWVRDWAIALLNVYQLEIERIQVCKLNCFAFCNHVASLCVDWDQAVDTARTGFALVGAPKDVHDFAGTYGTGNKIAAAPKFVDYMSGYDDPESAFTVAEFRDPEFGDILTRTISAHLVRRDVPNTTPRANKDLMTNESPLKVNKVLPPILEPLVPNTTTIKEKRQSIVFSEARLQGSPPRIARSDVFSEPKEFNQLTLPNDQPSGGLRKQPSQNSTYSDVFDSRNRNSGLDYSNPTNYTSQTHRSWASPRRKDKAEVQAQINRRLRDMTNYMEPPRPQAAVPISKDFSIDYIAKALEDLNAGGDGDVNQFRRSVRANKSASGGPAHLLGDDLNMSFSERMPASDLVDDSREVATRYNSISFKSPEKVRPKSMIDIAQGCDDLTGTIVRNKPRSLLKSPTKSYVNLNALVDKVTPVTRRKFETKACAKYTYSAREEGELSFKKGWHLYVIHRQADNWWVCELGENCGQGRGSVGLVPYNYMVAGDDAF